MEAVLHEPVKAIDFFPPFTVEIGGGKKDHSGGHCEYTSAFARATTATKETGAFLNETRIEERKKIPFLFFLFFLFLLLLSFFF